MGFIFWLLLIGLLIWLLSRGGNKKTAPSRPYLETDRTSFLREVISDLERAVKKTPDKKLTEQIQDYQEELRSLIGLEQTVPTASYSESTSQEVKGKALLNEDLGSLWDNWYSDNSINLLLYIGAFLIVASATIFVGFQWETLEGLGKAMVLTAITLAFFGAGFAFYKIPKIKNAGATFIAIGALLIPFNGLAWYNFVLRDSGASFGSVWLTTSLVAVFVYAFLAYFIRSTFYTYIAGFGGLSLALSVVNVTELNEEYYVLGAIFSAFVMLLSTRIIAHPNEETRKLYSAPLSVSAHIIMPLSILWGLSFVIPSAKLYTLEVSLSLLLATLYYLVAYSFVRQASYFLFSLLLLPLTIFIFTKWLEMPLLQIFYLLNLVFLGYLALSSYLKKTLPEESLALTITALGSSALVFLLSLGQGFDPVHLTMFALFPTLFGLLSAYFQSRAEYLYYNFIFLGITIFLYMIEVLDLNNSYYWLGLVYTSISVFFYLIASLSKNTVEYLRPFLFGAVLYIILGSLFTILKPSYFLVVNLVTTALLLDSSVRFKNPENIIVANIVLHVALWSLLRLFNTQILYYPFYYAGLSYLFYIAAQLLPDPYKNWYRLSGLVSMFSHTLLFGALSQSRSSYYYDSTTYPLRHSTANEFERNALFSSYATFILFSFDASLLKSKTMGYVASAIGMFTYLWQMKFLGVDHVQAYTLPLGIYFMVLAYLQRLSGKKENRKMLDFIGLGFLLVPTFFQSFGINGPMYALLLGLEGVGLFLLGNSLAYKTYLYAGIGAIVIAVFSQTYNFVLSLPRWLITAIAGLAFLGTAIYLMLRRKEPEN